MRLHVQAWRGAPSRGQDNDGSLKTHVAFGSAVGPCRGPDFGFAISFKTNKMCLCVCVYVSRSSACLRQGWHGTVMAARIAAQQRRVDKAPLPGFRLIIRSVFRQRVA